MSFSEEMQHFAGAWALPECTLNEVNIFTCRKIIIIKIIIFQCFRVES